MAQKKTKPKERQIGKKVQEKKHLINPRYKNTFWTIIVLIILLIFFIINNTSYVPKSGDYPPGYNPQTAEQPTHNIDKRLQMDTNTKSSK